MTSTAGIGSVKALTTGNSSASVRLLDASEHGDLVLDAYRAGIKACIAADSADRDLPAAAREVAAGKSFLSPRLAAALLHMDQPGAAATHVALSAIQVALLRSLAGMAPEADISLNPGISKAEMELERSQLLLKLGSNGIGGLLRYVVREGLCPPSA